MTENAVFVDGYMTKIHEDVIFTYDETDYMKPWRIRSKFTGDVDLTFTPFFKREAITNVKLVSSSVHQVVGYFNGFVILENGSRLAITQMLGCVEEHKAKW